MAAYGKYFDGTPKTCSAPVLVRVCELCGEDFEVKRENFYANRVCSQCDFEVNADGTGPTDPIG